MLMDYRELARLVSRITLKGVKTFKGREGVGLNANLLFDGEVVAECLDEGCGGEMRIYWRDHSHGQSKTEEEVTTYIASLNLTPEIVTFRGAEPFEMPYNLPHIIDTLVDGLETEKRYKRLCKTQTLVRLKDGQVRAFKVQFGKAAKDAILRKFGAEVVSFINEELA
jgi:hypothetical protein